MRGLSFLSKVDKFGQPYYVRGQNGQRSYQSVGGGIVSLTIYTLSLMYFVYILYLWQSGQIDPSSASFKEIQNRQIFNSGDGSIFDLTYWRYQYYQQDPFSDSTLIYIPIISFEIDGILQEPISILKSQSQSKYKSVTISIRDIELILDDGSFFKEALIFIVDCQEKYLTDNQKCATQEIIDKFNQQANFIVYSNYLETYNTKLKQKQSVKNDQFATLETEGKQFISIQMNSVNLTIEDGLILQNKNYLRYFDSVSITTQASSTNINMKLYGFDFQVCFILRLSPIIQQVSLRYSNLGEIFAMVGSIVSVLMSLGILVESFNGYCQDNLLIKCILEQYFHKKIETNQFGEIINIKGLQDLNQIKHLQQIAENKLNILNIIYQISRIEMFLIQKFGRNEIIQTNDYCIQANQFEESIEMNSRESYQFYIEDMNLLNYHQT